MIAKLTFARVGPEPTDSEVQEIAANCLLPRDDTVMWLQHLKTTGSTVLVKLQKQKEEVILMWRMQCIVW